MLRKRTLPSFAAAVAALMIFAALPLAARAVAPFTVVAIPDTQSLSGANIQGQVKWIVANRTTQNIATMAHQGDISNNAGGDGHYSTAHNAYQQLSNLNPTLPWGTVPGNHDYPADNYKASFGPTAFNPWPSWYGSSNSPSGLSSYHTFSAGGRTYLVLNVEYNKWGSLTPDAAIDWAQGVLNANRRKPTIINTHDYLNGKEQGYGGRTANGNKIFDALVKNNSQVFMVLCGHNYLSNYQKATNAAGKDVFQLLANWQFPETYSGDTLRQYVFDEDAAMIHVKTYSPALDKYYADGAGALSNQFDIPMNFDERLGAVHEPSTGRAAH